MLFKERICTQGNVGEESTIYRVNSGPVGRNLSIAFLKERSKWTRPHCNMQVGDIVIAKDDNKAKKMWSLVQGIEMYAHKADGLVHSVKVAIGTLSSPTLARECAPSLLERPIQKASPSAVKGGKPCMCTSFYH